MKRYLLDAWAVLAGLVINCLGKLLLLWHLGARTLAPPGPRHASDRKERELCGAHYIQVFDREKRQVVVVGAGPAGLAVGGQLRKRGVDVLLLERGRSVGESWLNMPNNLRLVTRWSLNELPDTPDSLRPTETVVSAFRFARYLEAYADYHRLPVASGSTVSRVSSLGTDGLVVSLQTGERIHAREVVNATGYFGSPFVPVFPGALETKIKQLHYGSYRSPAQIVELLHGTGKRILIVGKGLSAGQVMIELDQAGNSVELSARGLLEFGPSPSLDLFLQRFLPVLEWWRGLLGQDCGCSAKIRMQGGKTKRLVTSGRVPVHPQIARFEPDRVVFQNGSSGVYDLVLYCTGFRPHLAHLPGLTLDKETGLPAIRRMESREMPHLHFIGLDGERNFRSRFLRGIREDAVSLAERLALRLSR
jgi:putative flavoprotein involved in K+ transport